MNVLSRDGAPVPHDEWGDTVLVRPREHVRVAFVATQRCISRDVSNMI
jgi:hypothetical protein